MRTDGINWTAPATLLGICGPLSQQMLAMRAIMPTVPIARGTLRDMIRFVTDKPPIEQWRYSITADRLPYLQSEEIVALAAAPDFSGPLPA